MDPAVSSCRVALSEAQRQEARRISEELAEIASSGMVLPGSILERRTRCRHAGCKCMAEPPEPHGPYFQWTRKVAAKTVGRWLSAEQAEDYRLFVENDRRCRELLRRLEEIGLAVIEKDPRTRGRPRAADAVERARSARSRPARAG